jgi:hypothetical protein
MSTLCFTLHCALIHRITDNYVLGDASHNKNPSQIARSECTRSSFGLSSEKVSKIWKRIGIHTAHKTYTYWSKRRTTGSFLLRSHISRVSYEDTVLWLKMNSEHMFDDSASFLSSFDCFADGWMQEMESLICRNRFLSLTHSTTESLPRRGICSHALARVAPWPDVIFEVLRSIPSLVPPAKGTDVPKKRKYIDVES